MPPSVHNLPGVWDDDDHGGPTTRCECHYGQAQCPDCDGTGRHDTNDLQWDGCAACAAALRGQGPADHDCPACGGTGVVECPRCRGTGEREVTNEDYEAAHDLARERSER